MATDLQKSPSPTSDSFFSTQQSIHWFDDDQQTNCSLSPHSSYSSSSTSLCSVLDSTESSSEESDEHIAELTRQMAHYMIQDFDDDDDEPLFKEESGGKQGNLKVVEDDDQSNCDGGFIDNLVSEFRKKQALIDEQIRFVQVQRRKQEGTAAKEEQEGEDGIKQPPPQLQNQGRKKRGKKKGQKGQPEVMRAVFLGVPAGRAAAGTGVFLPAATGGVENRSTGSITNATSSPESCSKSGCSTVLMPGRVVQALKLHFDKMGPFPSPVNPPAAAAVASSMHFQQGALTGNVRYAFQLQQRSTESSSSPSSKPAKNHHRRRFQEMGLPQEWTY